MPIDRVDQLPLPNIRWYAGFSALGLFYATVYALTTPAKFLSTLFGDVWCESAVLNMVCCSVFLLTNFIYSMVFGPLKHIEQQHMRDKFWNFVFYKFIFVFGVMNVQDIQELLGWCVWFAILGTLIITEQLCKDRFQFVSTGPYAWSLLDVAAYFLSPLTHPTSFLLISPPSFPCLISLPLTHTPPLFLLAYLAFFPVEQLSFSPNTPSSSHAKILILLGSVLVCCAGLFMVCAIVGWQHGFNYFTFLYSEVFILCARALHTVIRYIIHLWDLHHDGTWENRSTYTYYTELILELAALSIDFLHHVHMLLWANMFLSVASLILLMKLRFLYQEIQRRLKRHRSYVNVTETLEKRFVLVPKQELIMSDEVCAICWEKMTVARRLPCGHIFHTGCLRSWLEQDTVCPTCRHSLQLKQRRTDEGGAREEGGGEREEEEEEEEEGAPVRTEQGDRTRSQAQRNRRHSHHNWLLHFNGASIASWLPTFSLQLHQDGDPQLVGNDAASLHRAAQQVHTMFPNIPLQAITIDLADTHSILLTVDRILNNSIYIPAQEVLPAPPPTPLGPRTDAAVEDPGLRPAEEPPKEERKQPEGVQAETAAVASDTEDGGTVVNNSGDVESPEAGAGSGLRNRRTQVDSERKSKDKETNVLPTETGVLPTNSSSKYSFVALEQRKEDLLRKAKRNYLLKRQGTSQS
eukprot:Em0018g864a